ncbi:MORC family CW-type zinc finger protein 3-like isoform X2 [Corticium candelabrum]|nr:MORC family CW-type zinc finger protein 3-like isoform X2 [Corticium candelabrum]
MDADGLHRMLSFGFCDKDVFLDDKHKPIGHYGNGFKSGSMRLGKDALVFTMHKDTMSVGFLSQSYLAAINAETILVPIVSWTRSSDTVIPTVDAENSLTAIKTYSLFHSEAELLSQFKQHFKKSGTGTHIIIYNLRQTIDGHLEFDLATDITDIMIPDDAHHSSAKGKYKKQDREDWHPAMDYSLRAYCSILYLKPSMKIYLRGKKVQTQAIAKSLTHTEVDVYRPRELNKRVKIVFGFSPKRHHYGVMMYHHNRLIKGYVRVGNQVKNNGRGVGVVGVIECNFLHPTHNKQDFEYNVAYRACLVALGAKLNEYWFEKKNLVSSRNSENQAADSSVDVDSPVDIVGPDQTWVQCDYPDCLKWRKLPLGTDPDSLPEKWFCDLNPDLNFRSCGVPEEEEDVNDEFVQAYDKKEKRKMQKERLLLDVREADVIKQEKPEQTSKLKQTYAAELTVRARQDVIRNVVDVRRAQQQQFVPVSTMESPLLVQMRTNNQAIPVLQSSSINSLPIQSPASCILVNTLPTTSPTHLTRGTSSQQGSDNGQNYMMLLQLAESVSPTHIAATSVSGTNSRKRKRSETIFLPPHSSQSICTGSLSTGPHNSKVPAPENNVLNSTSPREETETTCLDKDDDDDDDDVIILDDKCPVTSRNRSSEDKKHPFSLPQALKNYLSSEKRQLAVEFYKQSPAEIFNSLVDTAAELERLRSNVTKLLKNVASDLFSSEVTNLPVDELLQSVVDNLE